LSELGWGRFVFALESDDYMNTQTTPAIDPNSFLRQPDVLRLVPIGASTLWLWCKAGKFPAPIKLGERTTAWRASDVFMWLEAKSAAELDAAAKR
jgi:prophage regulatory protein